MWGGVHRGRLGSALLGFACSMIWTLSSEMSHRMLFVELADFLFCSYRNNFGSCSAIFCITEFVYTHRRASLVTSCAGIAWSVDVDLIVEFELRLHLTCCSRPLCDSLCFSPYLFWKCLVFSLNRKSERRKAADLSQLSQPNLSSSDLASKHVTS